jgi:hypothetical protein
MSASSRLSQFAPFGALLILVSACVRTPAAPFVPPVQVKPATAQPPPAQASVTPVVALPGATLPPTIATKTSAPPTPTAAANPQATPTAAVASIAATAIEATRAPCPPPAGEGPESYRDDVCVRKVGEVGAGFVRLRRNPLNGELFALNSQAQIFKFTIDAAGNGTPTLVHDAAAVGGGDFTLGMAFGPDGALYVVGNATKDKETRCTLRVFGR